MLPDSIKNSLRPGVTVIRSCMQDVTVGVVFVIARIKRLVHRPRYPANHGGVYVNLGCGRTNHPDFINVDGYPHPHVHHLHRIDRLPMFSDESVDLIYASHCLEHFKYKQIENVLCEWVRTLKKGAVLRVSVPDFDKLLNIYHDTGNPDDIVEQVMGGQDNRFNFHYVLFNKKNLSELLTRAGCVDICEWIPGSSHLTSFDDFSIYHKNVAGKNYTISLNLEARKK